ncbi:hypothetical protein [Kitasatospora griseola]|uniref:hypothetical protein n=1 Tax=Kitasatospora griseola TaxID=2064 RepID=UPI00166F735E|nr:hypothetical protein [Kitasatospora griseola]GGQ91111.1 hypothetical protein GCM10010195_53710 [Kitasatospora griseola]
MSSDNAVSELLRDAADLAPDTPGEVLADVGERLGRRRVLRRRAAAAAAAGAAMTLVALGGVAVQHGGASAPAAVRRAANPAVTGQFMIDTLTSLLPPGRVDDTHGEGSDAQFGGPLAHVAYDDGRGASAMTLSTDWVALPIGPGTEGTQCVDPTERPTAGCTRTVGADGSILVIQKFTPEPGGGPTSTWTAIWTGSDGRRVRLSELNSRTAGPPLTRPEPVLSVEQLAAVVSSPAWNPVFEVFATSTNTPASSQLPLPDAILATAESLLPSDAQHDRGSTPQTTPGAAHLIVTVDGRTSLLSISVTPQWMKEGNPRSLFADLAAGGQPTRTQSGADVITSTSGATKSSPNPPVRWLVDALLPDGTRVSISENNGTTGYDAQPGNPALTLDQLTALAAATAWQH